VTSLIVAKRYAKALLEIGREDGKYEDYGNELGSVAGMLAQSPDLAAALANPGFPFEQRKGLLNAVLAKVTLSAMVTNFFRLLMDRGRIKEVSGIFTVYQHLLDEVKGITRAQVISAASLNEADVSRLMATLKKLAGREVVVEVKEDPSLIGGVVARIGDLVLDGSVKTQLVGIKASLTRGDYV
jgi:F-type H+-transporting ATPase subunit delta